MNFFGRKKSPTATTTTTTNSSAGKSSGPAQALQNVKKQIDVLEKRIEFLEKKQLGHLQDAKRASQAKNKTKAMQALKRKKMVEQEINKLRGAVMNLEQQSMMVESASTTKDIIEGMKAGKEAASSIMKQVDLDSVADLQDDIAEQFQTQTEIDDILGNPLGGSFEDDDDLLAELDELEDVDELAGLEEEMDHVHVVKTTTLLPNVPQGTIHIARDEDAEALAALEAEMAM